MQTIRGRKEDIQDDTITGRPLQKMMFLERASCFGLTIIISRIFLLGPV